MRSGTLNVSAIVGLGLACEIAAAELPTESLRLAVLRDRLQSALTSALDQLQVNGPQTDSSSAQAIGASQIGASQSTGAPVSASVQPGDASARRLPGNLNITFRHVDSETLMMGLKDVAVSSGSACTSAKIEPSHVRCIASAMSPERCGPGPSSAIVRRYFFSVGVRRSKRTRKKL